MRRYHIWLGKRRTTISLDNIVSEYLALHLKHEPGTPAAHATVREWLQAEVAWDNDPKRERVSQWLLGRIVETIARPALKEAHGQWLDKKISEERAELARRGRPKDVNVKVHR
jgi:hypothetical protein